MRFSPLIRRTYPDRVDSSSMARMGDSCYRWCVSPQHARQAQPTRRPYWQKGSATVRTAYPALVIAAPQGEGPSLHCERTEYRNGRRLAEGQGAAPIPRGWKAPAERGPVAQRCMSVGDAEGRWFESSRGAPLGRCWSEGGNSYGGARLVGASGPARRPRLSNLASASDPLPSTTALVRIAVWTGLAQWQSGRLQPG